MTTSETGYLHGFTEEEQKRLRQQARFLEPYIYEKVDFSKCRKLLEVGCGVGAQTEILLEHFPQLHISCVDASPIQLKAAREALKSAIQSKQVDITEANAEKIPFTSDTFDSAFICWLLEHVPDPLAVLAEVRRLLKPGSVLYATEVLNSSFFLHPYSPSTLQYWFAFNDHQWSMGGDPFIGGKLGHHLSVTGYQNVQTEIKSFHLDNRRPKLRAAMIDLWIDLLLSGTPGLLEAKKVTTELVEGMKNELTKLKDYEDSVFFYSCVQARAEVW